MNNFKHIAIIGASGAIGGAFVEYFSHQDTTEHIYAFARSVLRATHTKVSVHHIDITQEQSVQQAAQIIPNDTSLDLVIIATGVLHQDGIMPEKSLQQLDFSQLQNQLAINALGPALVMKHFLPRMQQKSPALFAALSARVGSISDNRLGGWYSYRAAKAALNMLIKTTSIETQRKNPEMIIIGLHPGTVDSHLSAPFQKNIPAQQLFLPEASCQKMIQVMAQLKPEDSGQCFAYDGQVILP